MLCYQLKDCASMPRDSGSNVKTFETIEPNHFFCFYLLLVIN